MGRPSRVRERVERVGRGEPSRTGPGVRATPAGGGRTSDGGTRPDLGSHAGRKPLTATEARSLSGEELLWASVEETSPRILFVSHSPLLHGAERSLYELVRGIKMLRAA